MGEKCCRCGKTGEIGVELCKHNDHKEGLIIVCYLCHRKEHHKKLKN